jgi:hypothetical protein
VRFEQGASRRRQSSIGRGSRQHIPHPACLPITACLPDRPPPLHPGCLAGADPRITDYDTLLANIKELKAGRPAQVRAGLGPRLMAGAEQSRAMCLRVI